MELLYEDDAAFDKLAQWSARLLTVILDRGLDNGYLPDPEKLISIYD